MSHSVDDYYSFYHEDYPRARKAHWCAACAEVIPAGHIYARVRLCWDGTASTIKRCARCQTIHLHLREQAPGDTWPSERLDCGETYQDHWETDPPPEIAALAFASPEEMQRELARVEQQK